ncbi:MAG: tetratricopeptide repeat protein [Ardenticatenaceae bacterium]|nr:tetratricopeptide repeat protein [Ardenticatenaceae bacterium]
MNQILDFNHCRAERLYRQGLESEREGDQSEALALFEQAVELDSSHSDARVALAFHYRRLGRLDEAIAQCQAALEIGPHPVAYFNLGHALIDKNEHEAALEALRRCLELQPTFARAQYEIAFVYYLKSEYDVAITEFHRAAQIEPDWETYFFLGECYRFTRRSSEAERMYRKAMPLAGSWGQVEITKAQLESVARQREFPADADLSVKDRYYCDSGVVYLGTAQDSGLEIHPYFFYHFSYDDLAVTLKRFLAVIEALNLRFSAVAPVDIVSHPLAMALARRLGVGTEPRPNGNTLLVQALGETVEGLQDALERTPGATTFCLAASWEEDWAPDILGIHTPLPSSVPWYRVGSFARLRSEAQGEAAGPLDRGEAESSFIDPRPAELIATEILQALDRTQDEPTLPAQVNYYRVAHRRLRFL